METILKNELVEAFLAKVEEQEAFEARRAVAGEEEDSILGSQSAIATEVLENASELDLRRIIFASLPDEFTSTDLYQVKENHPCLLQEVRLVSRVRFDYARYSIAYALLRRAAIPETSRNVWRAHVHVSLEKTEVFRWQFDNARFCHTCIRDYLCSSGHACILIEGKADVIARRLQHLIMGDKVSISVLDTLEKIELPPEEVKNPTPFRKYHVVHKYESSKTYEVLARSEEDACEIVNETPVEPIEFENPVFVGEQVVELPGYGSIEIVPL